jgi:acyl carrier protein
LPQDDVWRYELATVYERVKKVTMTQLSVNENEVRADSNFNADLGADSLDQVELMIALEEEFSTHDKKITIPDEESEKMMSVQDVVDYIHSIGVSDVQAPPKPVEKTGFRKINIPRPSFSKPNIPRPGASKPVQQQRDGQQNRQAGNVPQRGGGQQRNDNRQRRDGQQQSNVSRPNNNPRQMQQPKPVRQNTQKSPESGNASG